jgi:hypothetical protein
MVTLRIHHPVPDFTRWKRAFDADPVDRRALGVIRYAIRRSVNNPKLVMIDLELRTTREAEVLLTKMRRLWEGSGSSVMSSPEFWIIETVETVELVEPATAE